MLDGPPGAAFFRTTGAEVMKNSKKRLARRCNEPEGLKFGGYGFRIKPVSS
jgi:hypothetical protein